jgi:hypothetical protein
LRPDVLADFDPAFHRGDLKFRSRILLPVRRRYSLCARVEPGAVSSVLRWYRASSGLG